MNFNVDCTLLITILLIHFSFIFHLVCSDEIKAVALITRHGERYPTITFPNDPNTEFLDKVGYGMLTPKGQVHMYNFGRNLRVRYPQLKNRNVTILKSSARQRCIDSIKLIEAGLNGPVESISQIEQSNVMSNKVDDDPLLNHGGLNCPARTEQINNDEDMKQFPIEFKELWDNVTRLTGHTYTRNDSYYVFDEIVDQILSALLLKLPNFEWASDETMKQAEEMSNKCILLMSNYEIEKKLSGLFFSDLLNQLKMAAESDKTVYFFGYATHDTTLGPIMFNLGLWPNHRPLYAEALIFVLKDDNKLELFFYDENDVIHPKNFLNTNSTTSTIEEFEKNVKQFLGADWKQVCHRSN